MNSANITEEEMKYLIEQYSGENINKVFSTGLLSHPFHAAGPRQHMFSVHYTQHLMLDNPESPRNFTGWEKQFGKYLNSYMKADKNLEIVAKINRHSSFQDMSYVLVVREQGTKNYDVIKVSHYEKLSDQHGFLRPFSYNDAKGPGSYITKDDVVYKANSLDEFGNYRYGINAKVAFMLIPEVKEDSIVVSESFAKRVMFHTVNKTEYVINKNDVLLNIYGNNQEYKVLPMVGEYVNSKGILFATRKMDKKNISADFTDMALQTLHITDNKFGAFGQVVDIDIKVNDVDELNSDPHREQLQQIYNDQLRYNQEIVNVLQPIVNDESNHITDRLEQCLFNARNYITPNIKYSSNTGNFEFAHITIYTAEEQRLTSAMKLTNRCGGKAVIGKVWPDEFMPIDKNGVRAEVICSSAGLVGRTNPDQLFDQTISYISDEILRRMKRQKTMEDSYKLYFEYLKDMSPEWGQFWQKYYNNIPHRDREELLNNLYTSPLGIMMYNPPAHNAIGWEILKRVARKYKIKTSKVKMCRTYHVSPELAAMYDSTENIDAVKEIADNYVFQTVDKVIKTKDGKKTKTTVKHVTDEVGILHINDNKNVLKLPKEVYNDNKWVDDYVWTDGEIAESDIDDESFEPDDLVSYINNIQAYESEWNSEEFKENQLDKHNSFDTTKARVFKKDDHTLVREFTSQHEIIIADVYMMVLKQMPDAAFSARSLGSVTPLGLPNKSVKKSEVGRPFGDTCNQMSDMDNNDLKNLVDPEKVNRFYAVQSTNSQLRSDMARSLMFEDPTRLHDLPLADDEVTDNIPAKMLNQYLSAISLEIGDTDEPDPYEFLDDVKYTSLPDLMKKAGVTVDNNPFVNHQKIPS